MKALLIDEELDGLLESQSKEEFEQLRKNIKEDGVVINPIVVWQGKDIIVDGMNRYRIAMEEGVPFTTIEMPFRDKAHAKEWMFKHQLGRRNGDAFSRSRWRAMIVESMTKVRDGEAVKTKSEAMQKVAADAGVSVSQIRTDLSVSQVLSTLPHRAKMNLESGRVASSLTSVLKLKSMPDVQKDQVIDILDNYEVQDGSVVFRSLDEIMEAVVEHQTQSEPAPPPVSKSLSLDMDSLESMFAKIPVKLDSVASKKKIKGSLWHKRVQAAFAAFVAVWREQCKKS